MFFVDTNIFLEFLLRRENTESVLRFLEWAGEKRISLVISRFSVHAIEAILSKTHKDTVLTIFLENLESGENLSVYDTSTEEEKEIVKTGISKGLDFDDALQYYVAKKTGCIAIASFDAHFDKTGLPRKTPLQILKENSAE